MFADVLSKILQSRSIKASHLAKETGISQGLMSEYVNSKKMPSLQNIEKIADYLNVSVDTLLGRELPATLPPDYFDAPRIETEHRDIISQLSDSELQEVTKFAEYLISKREDDSNNE